VASANTICSIPWETQKYRAAFAAIVLITGSLICKNGTPSGGLFAVVINTVMGIVFNSMTSCVVRPECQWDKLTRPVQREPGQTPPPVVADE
jgi:hypothetical protein